MNFRILFILLMLCVILPGISIAQEKSNEFTVLKGPYLGQKPFGKGAVIFLDGVISTEENPEMNSAFTRDGKEFYYCTRDQKSWAIFYTKEIDGHWIKPRPIRFSSEKFVDRDFTISPDENRIYFGSNRPQKEGEALLKRLNVFFTERLGSGEWSQPKNVGKVINGTWGGNYPCVAANGNLYFFTSRSDGIGLCDIYVSKFINERYLPPVCLSRAVNSKQNDWDAYVAPDESYIIFSSQNRSDTLGDQDLYISYKNKKGEWTQAVNMGERVNSESSEICPVVTLDGKYLFFTSRRRGNADIYWVDAGIIDALNPNKINQLQGKDSEHSRRKTGIVTDVDGNVYHTVKIGNQIWMAENLKVSRYRDGTPIPRVQDKERWSRLKTGAYCVDQKNPIIYQEEYGVLYNFYTVNDPRGLSPEGWHVPTEREWRELIAYLGGEDTAGSKMKDIQSNLWKMPYCGPDNESGFSARPAGGRGRFGSVGEIGYYATWWASTVEDSTYAWHWGLYPYKPGIRSNPGHKASGFSVRCIKDK